MIRIGKHRIYAGDFHTHWYWDKENPSVLLAGMNRLGLDFIVLQDGFRRADECDLIARNYRTGLRVFPGLEIAFPFGHIVTWLDRKFDRGKSGQPLFSRQDKRSPAEALRAIRRANRLTVFAHPGKNWPGAFNGTYKPLFDLYRRKLIDAIQIEEPAALLTARKEGLDIPVLAGFDIHCCSPSEREPDYLFDHKTPVFDYLTPCGRTLTLVFSEACSEPEIIRAVKNNRTVVLFLDDNRLAGPPELVEILRRGEYLEKRQEQLTRKNRIRIETGSVLVGEEARISVPRIPWRKQDRLYFPSVANFSRPEKSDEPKIKYVSVPGWLKRAAFYFPMVVSRGPEKDVFAILCREPVVPELTATVRESTCGAGYLLNCRLKNLSASDRKVSLEFAGKLNFSQSSCAVELPGKSTRTVSLAVRDLTDPGFEYPLTVSYRSQGFSSTQSRLVSFPVCRRLAPGESPWQTRTGETIILKDASQVMELAENGWQGPQDLSCRINLYWDRENFYLYAEVTDSFFYQNWTGWETFWGDSLQFALEPVLFKNRRGYGTNYEFALAKTKLGAETMVWYTPQTGKEQLRVLSKTARLKVLRREENSLTEYRLSLPWSSLAPLAPKKGGRFKIAILVNDNDGTQLNRKCLLFYGGNTGLLKDTSQAHTVTFV